MSDRASSPFQAFVLLVTGRERATFVARARAAGARAFVLGIEAFARRIAVAARVSTTVSVGAPTSGEDAAAGILAVDEAIVIVVDVVRAAVEQILTAFLSLVACHDRETHKREMKGWAHELGRARG